jgi:hypothetical protein
MIVDLADHDTMWYRTSRHAPGLRPRPESLFIRPGQIAIVPALSSVFEDQGSPTVLIFDMLDGLPNEAEVHAFAAGLTEPWRLRLEPTSPLERTRLIISALDPDRAQRRLGSTRSAIAENAARILAALDGRNHVAQTDLKRTAEWAGLPEKL